MVRIVVIGARRSRQGIGPFVARELAAAGAEVCAVVGRSRESAVEASSGLESESGIACRPYGDVAEALTREGPDAVVICSPFVHHAEHLEVVARHGCHCLCEKPLLWDYPSSLGSSREEATRALLTAFEEKGLHLGLLTQWPQTLAGFERLHPGVLEEPVHSFSMRMSPIAPGATMVLASAPHPLSMIQHLVGCGVIENVRAEYADAEGRDLRLFFRYEHEAGSLAVSCRFQVVERPPRPAGYAINDRSVVREIQLPEYTMFFEAEGRKVRIEDPLRCLTREFLGNLERGAKTDRRRLLEGVRGLEVLLEAMPDG